jgi:hypothetical protein
MSEFNCQEILNGGGRVLALDETEFLAENTMVGMAGMVLVAMLVRPAELVLEIPKVQSDLTITPNVFVNTLVFTGHWVTCQ